MGPRWCQGGDACGAPHERGLPQNCPQDDRRKSRGHVHSGCIMISRLRDTLCDLVSGREGQNGACGWVILFLTPLFVAISRVVGTLSTVVVSSYVDPRADGALSRVPFRHGREAHRALDEYSRCVQSLFCLSTPCSDFFARPGVQQAGQPRDHWEFCSAVFQVDGSHVSVRGVCFSCAAIVFRIVPGEERVTAEAVQLPDPCASDLARAVRLEPQWKCVPCGRSPLEVRSAAVTKSPARQRRRPLPHKKDAHTPCADTWAPQ